MNGAMRFAYCALRAAAAMSARLSLQISKRPAAVPELGVLVGRWHGAYSSRSGSHGANHQRDYGAAYTCLGRGSRPDLEQFAQRRAKLPISSGGNVPG